MSLLASAWAACRVLSARMRGGADAVGTAGATPNGSDVESASDDRVPTDFDEIERLLLASEKHAPADRRVADGMVWLAGQRAEAGQLEEAYRLLHRAIAIRERAGRQGGRGITRTMEALSNVAAQMGRYDEALEMRRRTLRNREKIHGPNHPEVAFGLSQLANLLWEMGQTRAAWECHRGAIDMVREAPVGQIPAELREALRDFPGRNGDGRPHPPRMPRSEIGLN